MLGKVIYIKYSKTGLKTNSANSPTMRKIITANIYGVFTINKALRVGIFNPHNKPEHYIYSHFTDEPTGSKKLSNFPKIMQLGIMQQSQDLSLNANMIPSHGAGLWCCLPNAAGTSFSQAQNHPAHLQNGGG